MKLLFFLLPVAVIAAEPADSWRGEMRVIDLNMHLPASRPAIERVARGMERAGAGAGVNLDGGTVTRKDDGKSQFERTVALAEEAAPGRFVHFMDLDYASWDGADFAERAVRQVGEGRRLGAAGLAVGGRLGLSLRDGGARLIKFDDAKLDAVWAKCGELGMPVSIHAGDELPAALDRVIARHPKTIFVCASLAGNAGDLVQMDRRLDERPNMMADLAGCIPQLRRHAPDKVRDFFAKHADRILFASGAVVDGEYSGDATLEPLALPTGVRRKVQSDNARRLLARSLPLPTIRAARIGRDFAPDGRLDEAAWKAAQPARIEQKTQDAAAHPVLSTSVRALWSDAFLYLGYECPYTKLNVFEPAQKGERMGLWEKDVVEAFIAPDPAKPATYSEYEWAPNGDWLDLTLSPVTKPDFGWDSKMEFAASVDEAARVWRVEVRIPVAALARPKVGGKWRINLYRYDKASDVLLAFSPTLSGTFHAPARFGWLEFLK